MNPLITAAGSSTDIVARTVGHKVSDALGQSVVIENKPGAGGTIGTQEAEPHDHWQPARPPWRDLGKRHCRAIPGHRANHRTPSNLTLLIGRTCGFKHSVNGAELNYRWDGPADAPVVLLNNSLMSSLEMWDWTVPALIDRYRVLRYDTRGHGRSSTPAGPYSIEMMADDAAGLLGALQVPAAHCVGLSMGGMAVQQMAVRHAHKVRSLVLCNTASEMPPRSLWEDRLATARIQGIAGRVDGTIKRWFTAAFVERAAGDIAKVRSMILGTGAEGYLACAGGVGRRRPPVQHRAAAGLQSSPAEFSGPR